MPIYGKIVVIKRDGKDGSIFPVTKKRTLIGKDESNDIRIQLPNVSATHCAIAVHDSSNEAYLENLSHNHPASLNGRPLPAGSHGMMLKNGDVFTVGERSFKFSAYSKKSSLFRKSLSKGDDLGTRMKQINSAPKVIFCTPQAEKVAREGKLPKTAHKFDLGASSTRKTPRLMITQSTPLSSAKRSAFQRNASSHRTPADQRYAFSSVCSNVQKSAGDGPHSVSRARYCGSTMNGRTPVSGPESVSRKLNAGDTPWRARGTAGKVKAGSKYSPSAKSPTFNRSANRKPGLPPVAKTPRTALTARAVESKLVSFKSASAHKPASVLCGSVQRRLRRSSAPFHGVLKPGSASKIPIYIFKPGTKRPLTRLLSTSNVSVDNVKLTADDLSNTGQKNQPDAALGDLNQLSIATPGDKLNVSFTKMNVEKAMENFMSTRDESAGHDSAVCVASPSRIQNLVDLFDDESVCDSPKIANVAASFSKSPISCAKNVKSDQNSPAPSDSSLIKAVHNMVREAVDSIGEQGLTPVLTSLRLSKTPKSALSVSSKSSLVALSDSDESKTRRSRRSSLPASIASTKSLFAKSSESPAKNAVRKKSDLVGPVSVSSNATPSPPWFTRIETSAESVKSSSKKFLRKSFQSNKAIESSFTTPSPLSFSLSDKNDKPDQLSVSRLVRSSARSYEKTKPLDSSMSSPLWISKIQISAESSKSPAKKATRKQSELEGSVVGSSSDTPRSAWFTRIQKSAESINSSSKKSLRKSIQSSKAVESSFTTTTTSPFSFSLTDKSDQPAQLSMGRLVRSAAQTRRENESFDSTASSPLWITKIQMNDEAEEEVTDKTPRKSVEIEKRIPSTPSDRVKEIEGKKSSVRAKQPIEFISESPALSTRSKKGLLERSDYSFVLGSPAAKFGPIRVDQTPRAANKKSDLIKKDSAKKDYSFSPNSSAAKSGPIRADPTPRAANRKSELIKEDSAKKDYSFVRDSPATKFEPIRAEQTPRAADRKIDLIKKDSAKKDYSFLPNSPAAKLGPIGADPSPRAANRKSQPIKEGSAKKNNSFAPDSPATKFEPIIAEQTLRAANREIDPIEEDSVDKNDEAAKTGRRRRISRKKSVVEEKRTNQKEASQAKRKVVKRSSRKQTNVSHENDSSKGDQENMGLTSKLKPPIAGLKSRQTKNRSAVKEKIDNAMQQGCTLEVVKRSKTTKSAEKGDTDELYPRRTTRRAWAKLATPPRASDEPMKKKSRRAANQKSLDREEEELIEVEQKEKQASRSSVSRKRGSEAVDLVVEAKSNKRSARLRGKQPNQINIDSKSSDSRVSKRKPAVEEKLEDINRGKNKEPIKRKQKLENKSIPQEPKTRNTRNLSKTGKIAIEMIQDAASASIRDANSNASVKRKANNAKPSKLSKLVSVSPVKRVTRSMKPK